MSDFPLQYTPEHLALAEANWASNTDGDTPSIQLPVRMLGIDAPELHYQDVENQLEEYDVSFANFTTKEGSHLDDGLKAYLAPRLVNKAAARHIKAGQKAHAHLQKTVCARLGCGLDQNGMPRLQRKLFIMVAKEVFDRYGRMLAYVNANYTKKEREKIPISERPTFNLQMMQEGNAVSLLIYPNVPKPADLQLVQAAVRTARQNESGFWAQGDRTLLPYEFRWIVDTIQAEREKLEQAKENGATETKRTGPDRYCGDLTTGELRPPQQYYRVLPENRLFFYPEHVNNALEMGFRLVEDAEPWPQEFVPHESVIPVE